MSESNEAASIEAAQATSELPNTIVAKDDSHVAIIDADTISETTAVEQLKDTTPITEEPASETLNKDVEQPEIETSDKDVEQPEVTAEVIEHSATQDIGAENDVEHIGHAGASVTTAFERDEAASKDVPGTGEVDHERLAIQDEAIQHLARRASEMSMASARSQAPVAVHKDAKLPAAPPPPPPPAKEPATVKPRLQPAFGEEQAIDDVNSSELPGMSEQAGEEIAHIIEQFNAGQAPGEEEIMSPILERQQPILSLPLRSSSLESGYASPMTAEDKANYFATAGSKRNSVIDDGASIRSRTSVFQPPPPSPDPETALPFDFHRFLEQLRHRTADPVARFLRSFLQEFGKKQWMAHEQVKIVSDFLEFISKKMAQCEVWRTVSDAEFDNAREGMEKLVMNRLYTQTFSPAIPPPTSSPRKSGRTRVDSSSSTVIGRRGQHQEDVERDDVIAQKLKIYGWIKEEHLDIKPIGDKGKKFLTMAQQELLKINTYRAPRDKVICVLNCCKVIFGFLKNSKGDQSADAFVPLLIYTALQARPEHLVSNVQYIWRFRNQDKLGGEAGYYMSSLMGVVQFVENLDRTMITISDQEFETHVEQAVSAIAEKHKSEVYEEQSHGSIGASTPRPAIGFSEKSSISRPEVTARNSANVSQTSPRRQKSSAAAPIDEEEPDAMSGLLRTIQKPLSSIGRIFSDESSNESLRASTSLPARTSSRGLSPNARPERSSSRQRNSAEQQRSTEAEVRQASVESAELQRERQRGIAVVVETLQGMFPNLEKEIIEDVVRAQEGNVGRAVDACLALSDQG